MAQPRARGPRLAPRPQPGRVAARRAGRAVCRLYSPLPLASRPDFGADCGVPHQRRGHGHHGQPVLCGHGLHQGRSGRCNQGLRRHHDTGGRLCGRGHGGAMGGDARADVGRRAQRPEQSAVCVAGRARPRRHRLDSRHFCRQPGQRHCIRCVYCLPLQPHQHQLLGHPICALQLHDVAGTQMVSGFFWAVCRRLGL